MTYQKKISMMAVLSASVVLMAGASVLRAHEGERGAWPCKEDAEKFCKDVQPGGGRIIKCLKEHESELSDACKAKGAEVKNAMKQKMGEAREACRGDIDKFCKDVKPGGGRIIHCLKQHKDELSDSCKKFGGEIRQKREEMKEKMGQKGGVGNGRMSAVQDACRGDFEKFCNDVQPGGGRIMNCMKQHSSELSGSCSEAFHGKEGPAQDGSDGRGAPSGAEDSDN